MRKAIEVLRDLGRWLMLASIGVVIGLVLRGLEMKKQKSSEFKIVNHHILPSSRGGTNYHINIAKVENRHHVIFHMLFFNKTPVEIITYLVEYFFAGQWKYVEQSLEGSKR